MSIGHVRLLAAGHIHSLLLYQCFFVRTIVHSLLCTICYNVFSKLSSHSIESFMLSVRYSLGQTLIGRIDAQILMITFRRLPVALQVDYERRWPKESTRIRSYFSSHNISSNARNPFCLNVDHLRSLDKFQFCLPSLGQRTTKLTVA